MLLVYKEKIEMICKHMLCSMNHFIHKHITKAWADTFTRSQDQKPWQVGQGDLIVTKIEG